MYESYNSIALDYLIKTKFMNEKHIFLINNLRVNKRQFSLENYCNINEHQVATHA